MTSGRLLAKRALALPLRALRFVRRAPRRWVLTFHEVGDHPWAFPAARVAPLIDALRGHADLVPLPRLLAEGDPAGRPRVALTFDDAYAGVARHAAPVLERAALRATVFVPTDLVGEGDGLPQEPRGLYPGVPLLGWASIRALARSGPFDFESHGASHRPLPALPAEERAADLERARERLAREAGRAPTLLAYPFGRADRATAEAASAAGYEHAFTTRHGSLRPGQDALLLPRADVRAEYGIGDVLAILRGDWDYLAGLQRLRAWGRPA